MKIIFLDIDGVVSTHRCQWQLDPEKMELIKRICDATDAKIVITSSWRGYNLKQTIENLVDLEREAGNQPFLYPELVVETRFLPFSIAMAFFASSSEIPNKAWV